MLDCRVIDVPLSRPPPPIASLRDEYLLYMAGVLLCYHFNWIDQFHGLFIEFIQRLFR